MSNYKECKFESARGQLLFCGLLLMFGLFAATPETAYAADKEGIFEGMLGGLKDFFGFLVNQTFGKSFAENVKTAGLTMAGNLVGPANILAGGIAIVTLLWKLTVAMVNKTSVVGATVEVLLFGIISATLINNFEHVVNQVWDVAMMAMSAVGMDIGAAFTDFVTSFINPIGQAFTNWQELNKGKGFWSSLFSRASLDWIGSMMMTIAIIILLVLSVVNIVGVFIMGPVFFSVGVVFGPLMIATIVSDFTRKWFDQWLNFMVGSAFLTAVAVAVLKLLTLTIGGAVQNLAGQGSTTLALLGVVLLMSSASKLFGAVPSITDAIFPGRTGAGAAISGGGGSSKVVGAAAGGAVGAAVGAGISSVGGGDNPLSGFSKWNGSSSEVKGSASKAASAVAGAVKGAANVAKNASSQNPLATAAGMMGALGGNAAARGVASGAKAAYGMASDAASNARRNNHMNKEMARMSGNQGGKETQKSGGDFPSVPDK